MRQVGYAVLAFALMLCLTHAAVNEQPLRVKRRRLVSQPAPQWSEQGNAGRLEPWQIPTPSIDVRRRAVHTRVTDTEQGFRQRGAGQDEHAPLPGSSTVRPAERAKHGQMLPEMWGSSAEGRVPFDGGVEYDDRDNAGVEQGPTTSNESGAAWPPDTDVAVGPTSVLTVSNAGVRLHNKATQAVLASSALSTFLGGAGVFDPRAVYDITEERFVVIALQGKNDSGSKIFVGVSTSASPLTLTAVHWHTSGTIDSSEESTTWADYCTLGIDLHNVYVSANQFEIDGPFKHATLYVIPKAQLYAGGSYEVEQMSNIPEPDDLADSEGLDQDNTLLRAATLQPATMYGEANLMVLVARRALVTVFDLVNGVQTIAGLSVYRLYDTDSLDTIEIYGRAIRAPRYADAAMPTIPQGDGTSYPGLDAGDTRLQAAVVMDGTLWVAQTIPSTDAERSEIRYYRIELCRDEEHFLQGARLAESGALRSDEWHYAYPAVAVTPGGTLGISFVGGKVGSFAAIFYTHRYHVDPPGLLRGAQQVATGGSNYFLQDGAGLNRYGDYSGAAVDPSNTHILWFYNELPHASTTTQWSSRLFSVNLCPSCPAANATASIPAGPDLVMCAGAGVAPHTAAVLLTTLLASALLLLTSWSA